jgi:hypothetical protein
VSAALDGMGKEALGGMGKATLGGMVKVGIGVPGTVMGTEGSR